jgi:NAD(P)-dependent dehydrogenase (short-subunit alcohol dehydrogenase family)
VADSSVVLNGKTVLVTGGTGKLGSAFARAMSAAGADVVITGRSSARLEATAAKIHSETGREIRHAAGDLTDREGMAGLAAQAWGAFGGIDAVVNSAVPDGSQVPSGDLLATPDDVWWRFFDPVVLGALTLARELVPRMAGRGGGTFINITSPTGVVPSPGMDAYGMAKGALVVLTKYMAREWGTWNIRANALSPGLIVDDRYITPETIASTPALRALLDRTSLGRPGRADDLIGVAVFLASDAASFISGTLIPVDGGRF